MLTVLLMLLTTLGAVGLFLAMPRGQLKTPFLATLAFLGAAALLLAAIVPMTVGGAERWWTGLLGLVGLIGGVRLITHAKPVYSALYFILVALSATGMLVLMEAEFLAAALLIIYAGAIMVTYVFVIMLAQQSGGPRPYDKEAREPALGVLCGFIVLAVVALQIASPEAASLPPPPNDLPNAVGTVIPVGVHLLTQYVVAIQIAGVLLLAAMVGAVAIARRTPTSVGGMVEGG